MPITLNPRSGPRRAATAAESSSEVEGREGDAFPGKKLNNSATINFQSSSGC